MCPICARKIFGCYMAKCRIGACRGIPFRDIPTVRVLHSTPSRFATHPYPRIADKARGHNESLPTRRTAPDFSPLQTPLRRLCASAGIGTLSADKTFTRAQERPCSVFAQGDAIRGLWRIRKRASVQPTPFTHAIALQHDPRIIPQDASVNPRAMREHTARGR